MCGYLCGVLLGWAGVRLEDFGVAGLLQLLCDGNADELLCTLVAGGWDRGVTGTTRHTAGTMLCRRRLNTCDVRRTGVSCTCGTHKNILRRAVIERHHTTHHRVMRRTPYGNPRRQRTARLCCALRHCTAV